MSPSGLVERGSNYSQVDQQLREVNLIQQPLWFEFLARLNGQHHRLQAGEFQLDPRWNHATSSTTLFLVAAYKFVSLSRKA